MTVHRTPPARSIPGHPLDDPRPATPRGWRRACAAGLVALLAACGGGGGDGGGGSSSGIAEPLAPPATSASLASTTTEAAEAAQAAVSAGARVAERAAVMNGISAALGGPVTASSLPPADRKYALAVTTAPCLDLLDAPCSGNAVIDTDIADNATRIVPGNYADFTFNSLSGRLGTATVGLGGRMRVEFEAPVDLASALLRGLSARIRLDAFTATVNGATFGPVTENARLQIDSAGVASVTAGSVRYGALSGVTISGDGSFLVGNGSLRLTYWGAPDRCVDVTLTNWRVSSGRPTLGSQASISGANGSITLQVTAESPISVTYLATMTSGNRSTSFTVTAAYPTRGTPTYTAVPL